MSTAVLLCADEPSSRFLARELAQAGFLSGILLESGKAQKQGAARLPFLHRTFGKLYHLFYYDRARRAAEARLLSDLFGQGEPSFPDGIPMTRVGDANGPEARVFLKGLDADVLVVWGTRILEPGTFGLCRKAALNVHLGILPDFRGSASEFWALHEGKPDQVGWTLHRVTERLDAGPIVAEGRLGVSPRENEWDLRLRNIRAATAGLLEALRDLDGELARARPQPEGPAPRRGHTPWQHARLHWRLGRSQ